MTTSPKLRPIFGRESELARIADAIADAGSSGVLIEGEIGLGKSLLAQTIHRDRGAGEIWIRGDRVLRSAEFGAFGLLVDLDGDPGTLLGRIVAALRSEAAPRVVFVDDAQFLDDRSLDVLTNLAIDGDITLVATTRPVSQVGRLPFFDLVDDGLVDRLSLGVLAEAEFQDMVEHQLGGIVSKGVLDIVAHHSGRNPGRLIELLRYTRRRRRLYSRRGVWLLDGLDIDYDERARDYTRLDLSQYSPDQQDALELAVLAGEVDVELMLSAGLGPAADSLVALEELRVEQRARQVYVAVEKHTAATVRYIVPTGRSRQKFDLVAASADDPSDWSRVLRADWALGCGAPAEQQDLIDNARRAASFGQWLQAKRLLTEISTDRMSPHEHLDLARLYCDTNTVPMGLDVLARCVRAACCPQVVLDALVIWKNRDFSQTSPALGTADFRRSLDRLADGPNRCGAPVLDAAVVWETFDEVERLTAGGRPFDRSLMRAWDPARFEPRSVGLLFLILHASVMIEDGRGDEVGDLLDRVVRGTSTEGTGMMGIRTLQVRLLLQNDRVEDARELLSRIPSHDIAYLATWSGPSDLLWAQIHLLEGSRARALRCLRAAVEALDFRNHLTLLAIALAEAEFASMMNGHTEAADDYHSRFETLPRIGYFQEYSRARVLRVSARWLRTSDPRYKEQLVELLAEARAEGAHGTEALIHLHLYRHFGEGDPDEFMRVAGHGTSREFALLGRLGAALREGGTALLDFAEICENSMPDLAGRCRGLAGRPAPDGAEPRSGTALTGRERQISALIVSGHTNAEIAAEIGVRVRTVEGHTYRLFRKLGITRREQVAEVLARSDRRPESSSLDCPNPATGFRTQS